ncbi:unnamed protein product [Pelagomonas calceolata]|uniref:Uncharacterized protein n=1 Tax=Pelagomonas calceolata TaxID=35677 RepID=A0A8J2SKL2_9STRA|nr:unnamed protein product [Pelagomonas calceolata]|mmetsp:Transcript_17233/g.49192  ORF Transcript_17233/g.49192 Transcript_17233/m.49192 type:complete len:433 (-) Transcript_17233:55-1353(-)
MASWAAASWSTAASRSRPSEFSNSSRNRVASATSFSRQRTRSSKNAMTSASAPACWRVDSVDRKASAKDSSASLTLDARNSLTRSAPSRAARESSASACNPRTSTSRALHLLSNAMMPLISEGDSFDAMAAAIWELRPTLFWGETVVRSFRPICELRENRRSTRPKKRLSLCAVASTSGATRKLKTRSTTRSSRIVKGGRFSDEAWPFCFPAFENSSNRRDALCNSRSSSPIRRSREGTRRASSAFRSCRARSSSACICCRFQATMSSQKASLASMHSCWMLARSSSSCFILRRAASRSPAMTSSRNDWSSTRSRSSLTSFSWWAWATSSTHSARTSRTTNACATSCVCCAAAFDARRRAQVAGGGGGGGFVLVESVAGAEARRITAPVRGSAGAAPEAFVVCAGLRRAAARRRRSGWPGVVHRWRSYAPTR